MGSNPFFFPHVFYYLTEEASLFTPPSRKTTLREEQNREPLFFPGKGGFLFFPLDPVSFIKEDKEDRISDPPKRSEFLS